MDDRFKKAALHIGLIGLLCTLLIACRGGGSSPKPESTNPLPSAGQATIFRDEWGVPHIYAREEENGFFGLGYAMAEDQLERLLMYVLLSRGEVAAHVIADELPPQLRASFTGAGQLSVDEMIEQDYQVKLWRLGEHAKVAIARLDPQLRLNYERFADGVNRYVQDHPEKNPTWAPTAVTLLDIVTIPHALLWGTYQAGVGLLDCRRGGAVMKTALGSKQIATGGFSNQWAVMPQNTATGGAILLTDPHGGIDGRFSYEFRMHAGDFRSAGYALGPMPIVARNEHVGWAMTTGSPDVADCYRIETMPNDRETFLYDGEEMSFEKKEIRIGVRDRDPVIIQAAYTNHNDVVSPVVAEGDGHVFVVSTPYLANMEGFHNSLYEMNRAKNVDEFKEAQRSAAVFPQNILAADTSGDIIYIHGGLTPIRSDPDVDWTQPLDGNSSKYAWRGLHEIDDLLVIKSPPSGYLTNNNIDPRFMDVTPHRELDGKPEYVIHEGMISTAATNGRGFRALEVLSATETMTEQDAFDLAFDVTLVKSSRWIELLQQAIANAGDVGDEGQRAFVRDLLSFDGAMHQDSTAALKFVYWREALRLHLKAGQLRELAEAMDGMREVSEALGTSLVAAAGDAAERLSGTSQGVGRTYGDEFRIGGGDGQSWPLSGGTVRSLVPPAEGAVDECGAGTLLCPISLFAIYHAPPDENNQRMAVIGSRIMRLDFYSPDGIRSFSLNNPGISDDGESPHFNDQARELMSNRRMKPVYFDWQDLEPNVKSSVTLTVE